MYFFFSAAASIFQASLRRVSERSSQYSPRFASAFRYQFPVASWIGHFFSLLLLKLVLNKNERWDIQKSLNAATKDTKQDFSLICKSTHHWKLKKKKRRLRRASWVASSSSDHTKQAWSLQLPLITLSKPGEYKAGGSVMKGGGMGPATVFFPWSFFNPFFLEPSSADSPGLIFRFDILFRFSLFAGRFD